MTTEYKLYMPTEQELINAIEEEKNRIIKTRSHYEKCAKCIKIRNDFLSYINYYVILKEKERVIIWK